MLKALGEISLHWLQATWLDDLAQWLITLNIAILGLYAAILNHHCLLYRHW